MAKRLSTMTILFLLMFPVAAWCGETGAGGAGTAPGGMWYETDFLPAQHFTLQDNLSASIGYRFTGVSGSRRAAEYDYLHPSVAGGLDIHYYPLPFMVDAHLDYRNEYDHNAELTARWFDMVKLEYRSTGLFHNLDHYVLVPFAVSEDDPDARFGVKINDNDLTLVVKSPGRPYHVYVNLHEFDKGGTVQQRFIFLNSEKRDIDWVTRELTAGINGNVLGLFEVDYHHTIKTFNSDLRSVIGPDPYNGPLLLHNQTPDFQTNLDTVSVHTDQSRPLSASGTFTIGDKKNKTSGAKVNFHREYGDVTYMPLSNLLIAVKYGHQKLTVNNPETVQDLDFTTSPATVTEFSGIRNSISTTRDRGVVAVSYHPIPKLMLLGKYTLDSVVRHGAKDWNDDVAFESLNLVKAGSITHKGSISATFTPERHTKLRAGFSYAHNGDPSYIVDYRNAYDGFVSGTWVPRPGLVANAQYRIFRANNPVRNPQTDAMPIDQLNRHVDRDTAGAGVTWYAVQGLVLGTRYDFLRFKAMQDIIYSDGVNVVVSEGTPYRDQTHEYTVFARYCLGFLPVTFEADFSQSWSKGNYRLATDLFGIPPGPAVPTDGIAQLVDQYIRDTRGLVKAEYEIYRGWGTTLSYGVSNFHDLQQRDYTGKRDGTAHYGTVLLTKKW